MRRSRVTADHPYRILVAGAPGTQRCGIAFAHEVTVLDTPFAAALAAAWPELPAPDEAFVTLARDRLGAEPDLTRAADLFVAFHAGRANPVAVTAISQMLESLRRQLRAKGADQAVLDELLPEVLSDLVTARSGAPPPICGYTGRGPLWAWLRVTTVRRLIKQRRRANACGAMDDLIADLASPALSPELTVLRERYAMEFRAAFADTVANLEALDRTMLRQHHLDGLGLQQLAELHGFSRATAVRRLAAARGTILTEVRRRLLSELCAGGETVDSIIRLVHNELELSLARYLS